MSQIVTLYSDKERTDALYPRTKVSAISDDNNTPLKELMTGMVKQEEGGTEEEVVTPINADTLGGKLTANNVVFYEEEMVDEFGQVVVKNADKLENHPASYFATSEELNTKANKSDVLTYEEIQASTDLTDKIASASALKIIPVTLEYSDYVVVKDLNNTYCYRIGNIVIFSFNIQLEGRSYVSGDTLISGLPPTSKVPIIVSINAYTFKIYNDGSLHFDGNASISKGYFAGSVVYMIV